jgi:predicted nucleotidyltransferase
MEQSSIEAIITTLNQYQVRYLIVGGLAVVAHGYVRFTADVDLMLAVDEKNLTQTIAAIKSLDYQPRAPVKIEEFADPVRRREWAIEKNMTVFSLFSPKHTATEIDLFLEPPIEFENAYSKAMKLVVAPGVIATVCSVDDLIELKSKAARPRDLEDIAKLRELHKDSR